ncbi:MAG: succinate dehydrogenase assembly factor 2 [Thiotrichales bacterium]|nr:succinate dehydrogenase assembly factor 2 [Thiotrichales bacterium]
MTELKQVRTENQQACLNRLKFQCKRGNLETELLLIAYIEKLVTQPAERQTCFENLLNESDQALFNWLLPHTEQQTEVRTKINTDSQQRQSISNVPEQYRTLIADIRDNYLNSSR